MVQALLQRPFLGMSRTFAEMSRLHRTFYWTDVSEFSKGMELPFYRLFKLREDRRRKRLIFFVYIAARLASFCIEQFAIPEQVVFNLLLCEV